MHTKHIRVLHVIARFNVGGTARYLSTLLPRLQSEKVEVLLAVGHPQNGEVEDSALGTLTFKRIEELGRRIRPIRDLKSYFALRKIVNEFQPDIIHSHTFKAGLLSRSMFIKIPKIHTFHGHLMTDPEFSKSQIKIITWVERILAKLTEKLIVTGNRVATDLLSLGIGEMKQYISIPGAIINTPMPSKSDARSRLEIGNTFVVLWLARMAPVKQPRLFVEVARLCPDLTFVMCGDGNELEAIRVGAPSNLKITGMVDPVDYLAAADIFVSTSANDGIPYSILEAQAAGLPVVAVASGAISEIITDGVNGFLTTSRAEEIAERIGRLNKGETLRASFAAAARANSESLSLNPQLEQIHEQVYLDIIGK